MSRRSHQAKQSSTQPFVQMLLASQAATQQNWSEASKQSQAYLDEAPCGFLADLAKLFIEVEQLGAGHSLEPEELKKKINFEARKIEKILIDLVNRN